ncbi:MAG: YbhB/YbcL family Raf kinase inhibitor-like protein [Candidatus Omnitrophica bacterium]|nr:YbhB/YbcL family Raf kinase inhibitor-like protein [Candidatus Omnitrophota bacterium]
MNVRSTVFTANTALPLKYTCDGEGVNPPLAFEEVPEGTKTLAVILEDMDASPGERVHWLVYDIPPVSRIDEHSIPGKQGINDFGKRRYRGPCPLSGIHRYRFKVFALNTDFDIEGGAQALEEASTGHVIEEAELICTYARQQR